MRSCNFLSLLIFHSWLGLIVLLTPSSLHAFFPQNQPKIKELQEEADRIGKNNLDSVLLLLKMADDLAPKKDTQKIQAENSWIKAKTYYGLRDYSESKKFGELAIRMANSAKHYQVLADAHNLLGILIKREGRVDSAIDEYRLSLKYKELLSDSLGIAKTLQNIGLAYRELREVYESEKKDEQITQLELENEVVNAKSEANAALADKQRSEKLIFVITALALFVLAITLYFYFRQRLALTKLKVREEKEGHIKAVNELMVQQQTKTLEAMVEGQEKERKRIAKELHDHFGSLMAAVKVNLTAVAENNFITIENSDQMKNLSVLVDKACEDIR
uniref:histidine kinase n=1 Tax=Roseivirga sp. TaxID=1964215 RepID=UPI0040481860